MLNGNHNESTAYNIAFSCCIEQSTCIEPRQRLLSWRIARGGLTDFQFYFGLFHLAAANTAIDLSLQNYVNEKIADC